jgi:hypothetical protein
MVEDKLDEGCSSTSVYLCSNAAESLQLLRGAAAVVVPVEHLHRHRVGDTSFAPNGGKS